MKSPDNFEKLFDLLKVQTTFQSCLNFLRGSKRLMNYFFKYNQ